jgi:ribosomal protein S2
MNKQKYISETKKDIMIDLRSMENLEKLLAGIKEIKIKDMQHL